MHATDLSCPVCRCAVLLDYEIVTRYFLDALTCLQYFDAVGWASGRVVGCWRGCLHGVQTCI